MCTCSVQDIAVNVSLASNAVTFQVDYTEDSTASGVLLILMHLDDNNTRSTRSAYLVLDRVNSSKVVFTSNNISQERYLALAYDVEMDGLLQIGNNSLSASKIFDINNIGKKCYITSGRVCSNGNRKDHDSIHEYNYSFIFK